MSAFTDEERHSMMIGFLEILNPFKPRYKIDLKYAEYTTKKEYHYYLGGRAIALPIFFIEVLGMIKLFSWLF